MAEYQRLSGLTLYKMIMNLVQNDNKPCTK